VLTPLSSLPTSIPAGTTFAYAVSAANARLASLSGNGLGLTLPPGLELVGVTSTLGSCTGLSCALGSLLAGDSGVVVYLLKAVTEGTKNLTLTLSHLGIDASPLNNVLNLSTTVTPATVTPGKDTTAPSVLVMLGKDKLRIVATKGLRTALGWTEGGKLTLKVKIPGKVAKRLKLPTLVGKRTITTTKAGTMKVRLKLTRKAAKKLAASKKQVRLIVKAQMRDPAGNVGRASASGIYRH
jgi:hypothetical protein